MLRKAKFRAIWLILFSFALFIMGCTITAEWTLNPNLELMEVPPNLPKYDMSVGIMESGKMKEATRVLIEGIAIPAICYVKTYPGYIHLVASSLKHIFENVSIVDREDSKFDLVFFPQLIVPQIERLQQPALWGLTLDFQMRGTSEMHHYRIDIKVKDESSLQNAMKTAITDLANSPLIISCYANKKKNDGTNWATLAKSPNKIMRNALAIDTRTPANILEQLADDPDYDVRHSIAQNPSTPANVLEKLSKDSDKMIQQALSTNPNTPRSVVTMMILSGFTIGDEKGEIALNDRLIEWKNKDLANFFESLTHDQINNLIITMEKTCMRLEMESKKFKNKKDTTDMQMNANQLKGTYDASSQVLSEKFANIAQALEMRVSLINGIIEAARTFLDK